jgi:predicted dinucleotide-binding enzyme
MSYAIVGFGKIGQALAHAFARNNIDVILASRRPPEQLAPQARTISPGQLLRLKVFLVFGVYLASKAFICAHSPARGSTNRRAGKSG